MFLLNIFLKLNENLCKKVKSLFCGNICESVTFSKSSLLRNVVGSLMSYTWFISSVSLVLYVDDTDEDVDKDSVGDACILILVLPLVLGFRFMAFLWSILY